MREFGVRMALGASASRVARSVICEGLRLTGIGLATGFVLSLVAGNLARGQFIGVTPTDPATYAAVFGILAVVALAASYVPARRALRVDPLVALRQE